MEGEKYLLICIIFFYKVPVVMMNCKASNESSFISRHVLQEMTVDTFVPNDTKIQNDGNKPYV